MFGAVLNLVLSFVLGRWVGLYGVTLATVIGYGITEVWYNPYLFCRQYQLSLRTFATESLKAVLLSVPWLAGVWMLAHRQAAIGWFSLGSEFTAMSLLGAAYAWSIIFTRSDRALWRGRMRRMLASFSVRRP